MGIICQERPGGPLLQFQSISCRPDRARSKVFWSAYSRSPPTGRPRARRVTRTPRACRRGMEVLRRGLPLHGRVGRQDDFLHTAALDAFQQRLDLQIIRTDAFDGREHSLQHVVFPFICTDAFERQHIQRFFHHADHRAIPLAALADLAALTPGGGDIETFLAESDPGLEIRQRFRQSGRRLPRGRAAGRMPGGRRFSGRSREAFECKDQVLDGIWKHDYHPVSVVHSMACATDHMLERQSTRQRTHDLLLEFAGLVQRQVDGRQHQVLEHFSIGIFQQLPGRSPPTGISGRRSSSP